MAQTSRIAGFRSMSVAERRHAVANQTALEDEVFDQVDADAFGPEQAANLSENVFGVFSLPLGTATNFTINGTDVLVPMATEEASVIAAASNAARIARPAGGFHTSSTTPIMQAQIQLLGVADPHAARSRIFERQDEIIDLANAQDPKLVEVGGGVKGLQVRLVEAKSETYVLVHLLVDVRDAMGANAVNTMAEAASDTIAAIAEGRALLRILTNKADLRLSRARAIFDKELLGGEEVIDNILHAYELAAADPYRAATHNKGIMNGISAVVLATGNDTRAVEAGAHSHAVVDGRYTSLSAFEKNAAGDLVGTLEMPMPVGLVGGATKVHPAARAALQIAEVKSAADLAELIVAAGLAQNLAALRVLATEGVQRGHMSLHAKNLAVSAGATDEEAAVIVDRLIAEKAFRFDRVQAILTELRTGVR
ncbi:MULTISPECIES: hydroxymethylglutaryl-CoA reductase, degradative [unclassified Brevibacterium]|uniref:hydroxymethylglutaryl-CoA reductase, degradative n=1 Tax=unclassified Brevibacterium TaxID=2614124 RepID=UPI001E5053EE|nr:MULTISPECIES: hydroxymethylglutaryl-CoA reductase, degradative [unclassified Brevibacterium]MCD1286889.1 hydroxymethylglutaryl-CoA reductase, degradative [Brevibacterium sp. CCUG 69071]MDK8433873.1 hydroxymethylglutaryl-CoA reductase, degradative [Brevibacterium sp. H-BE7]